jgi:hypothetical protein
MIFRSRRVVLPDGVRPVDVHVENGRIARIDDSDARLNPSRSENERLIDVGDLVISPGLVDTHVHVNEPGRTEWEGFDTATRAAAAGGVTTIVDMPLNSVPATTNVEALEAKRAAARGRVHVDVAFWGGVIPGNAGELDGLVDAGVRGFKCFLAPSGVDEFQHVTERDLREALPIVARRGVPLLVHAEHPDHLTPPTHPAYLAYLASRPPRAERAAVEMMIRLAREFAAHVHIVHVACGRRGADHRGNVSALPDLHRCGRRRWRDGIQMRAADPRRVASRRAMGRSAVGRARPRRHRSFAGAAGDEVRRRLHDRLGRDRVTGVVAGGDVDGIFRRRPSFSGWPRRAP